MSWSSPAASMASHTAPSSSAHELLTCNICEELYDDSTHQAKFLACFHTFCSQCLNKLLDKQEANSATIQCPNCRSHTQAPENGTDGLQTNFYISSIKEITETVAQPKVVGNIAPCYRHANQSKSYYCVTCGTSLCPECEVMAHTAMAGHSVITISDTETSYLQEINVSRKSLAQNERHLQLLESEMALLIAAKDNAVKDMKAFIKLAHEQLEQRDHDIMNLISHQFEEKQNALLDKQNEIKEAIKALTSDITKAENITKIGDLKELKAICEKIKNINEKTQSTSSRPNLGENCLGFDSNQGMTAFKKSVCTLGQIYATGFLRALITPSSTKAIAGQKATFTLEVFNNHAERMPIPPGSLSVEVRDLSDTKLHTAVCPMDSQCTVTFTPQMSGIHKMSTIFRGQQLINEQADILVSSNDPVLKFGKRGLGNGTFRAPWSVAIDNADCLHVADCGNRLIQKFTAEGEFLSQFSVASHEEDNPLGCSDYTTVDMALDLNKGRLFCMEISHEENFLANGKNILVFDLAGQLQHKYTPSNVANALFIAVTQQGEFILSDIANQQLLKVDQKGSYLCPVANMESPGYIAMDEEGRIIVPDKNNDRVTILSADGSVQKTLGSPGTGKGQLKQPRGIATDGQYILVGEAGNNRIQVFTYDGAFVSMIESSGDPLFEPRGLAVTKDGHVYVADRNHNCIKKYKYRDMP